MAKRRPKKESDASDVEIATKVLKKQKTSVTEEAPEKDDTVVDQDIQSGVKPEEQDESQKIIAQNKLEAEKAKNSGNELVKSGQYQDAIALYIKATKLDPKEALYFTNLGLAYLKSGQYKDAIASCIKATKLDPKEVAYLGYAYCVTGQYQEAVASYIKATELAQLMLTILRIWVERTSKQVSIKRL